MLSYVYFQDSQNLGDKPFLDLVRGTIDFHLGFPRHPALWAKDGCHELFLNSTVYSLSTVLMSHLFCERIQQEMNKLTSTFESTLDSTDPQHTA